VHITDITGKLAHGRIPRYLVTPLDAAAHPDGLLALLDQCASVAHLRVRTDLGDMVAKYRTRYTTQLAELARDGVITVATKREYAPDPVRSMITKRSEVIPADGQKAVDARTALYLLNTETWGMLFEEVDEDGNPISAATYAPPTQPTSPPIPGGRR
jgi:hypothetical protein